MKTLWFTSVDVRVHPKSSVRASLGLRWFRVLAAAGSFAFCRAGVAQEIKLERLEPPASNRAGVSVREVLAGEVPGVVADYVAIVGPARHSQPPNADENVVWFFLGGKSVLRIGEQAFPIEEETIARAPLGWAAEIEALAGETVLALRVRKPLNAEDRADLTSSTSLQAEPYVKTFRECTPYGEAIKSRKTVSRTLLPEGIVPRMAAGTVETAGPDQVGRHKHPMLEQFFVGLRGNDATVSADDANVSFPQFSILHIPLGSMHGAQVADGCRLYYIWLDFFATKEGQAWLKTHKPVAEEKSKAP